MMKNIMKKLIVFDLDGTLAVSKSSIDKEMSSLLIALLRIVKVAVISGGDWPQFEKQLLANLPKDKFWRNIVGFFKLFGSLATIILYPKYLKKPIPERISGSDFVWDLSNYAAKNDLKIFLLGGDPTVPEQAALKLQTDIYGLKVAGTFEGSPKLEDESKILELMKKDKPDILFVAYGVPAEELWLEKNLVKTGAKIGIGVGGTFDFLAGRRKRAPKFVRAIGLEWLWRLILEPKRYRRQAALPKLVAKVYKYKITTIDK